MPLSRRDLEQIRAIVRDELARLRGRGDLEPDKLATAEARGRAMVRAIREDPDAGGVDPAILRDARERIAESKRRWAERERQPIPNTPYLATYDAARLSGIFTETLRGMAKRGVLASRKVKGRLEFSRADLEAWVAKHPRSSRRTSAISGRRTPT